MNEITGRHHMHFVGKTNADLGMPYYLCLLWESALKRAIAAKSATTAQFQFPAPGGKVQFFESRIVPEFDAAGEVESLLCITSNVTEREKMLQTLRATEQRLVKADKSKDEFLATLAHELKTPLSAIATGIEILQLTQQDEKSHSALELMKRQSDHLDALVEELWDVGSIVQQKFTYCWEPVNLALIINDAVALCMAELDRAGHHLNLQLPDDPVMIYGDKRRLLQIFVNLISNSIKYTPAGGKLRIAATSGPQLATVEVQDNGIGIPEERQSQLFDIFFQVHREGQKPMRGLGIGLAVVKRLVEMHHGTVEIVSGGNAIGTSVTINFPHMSTTLRSRTDHRE